MSTTTRNWIAVAAERLRQIHKLEDQVLEGQKEVSDLRTEVNNLRAENKRLMLKVGKRPHATSGPFCRTDLDHEVGV